MTGVELRVLKWIGEKKLWAKWGRLHTAIYRATGGRIGHSSGKITNLLLTTTGRKSGQPRTVPLSYIRDGEYLVVVASNGGADRDPVWWLNLSAAPEASVQVEGDRFAVTAREADDAERERLWPLLQEANLFYTRHRANTERRIPIVLLSRRDCNGQASAEPEHQSA